jgi:hypothetical protein
MEPMTCVTVAESIYLFLNELSTGLAQEKQAMRALILGLSVLAIVVNSDAAKAGLSTTPPRNIGIRRCGNLSRRSKSGNRG